ncbi:MAG: beta-lactamase family protein [Emcibacteraceae bacterium]|nr:beta-lactamase family protein [Emcibacteraceae bacterium]
MVHFLKIFVVVTAYIGFLTSAFAQEKDYSNFIEKIDNIFSDISKQSAPGCSVGVIHNGSFIHKAGYGMANLEHNIALGGNTVFRMASISKQFTAMAVLNMAQDGIINLDEDIRTYLPELNDYGHKVSIRSMLGHYSGMGDYDLIASSYEGEQAEDSANLRSVAGGPYRLGNEDYLTNDEFYEVVKHIKLIYPPETKMVYSNLAYYLLSILVEKQTGLSLRQYSKKHIFEPLAMNDTLFSDNGVEIIKNRASGYAPREDGGFKIDMTNLFIVGDGGLHTSVNDFLKWDQNFYKPRVGKNPAELVKQLNTPTSEFKFGENFYANGQSVTTIDGHRAFAHSGGWLGTSTYYIRFPDDKFSVVTLCNNVNQSPSDHSKAIAKLYFDLER